MATWKKVHVQDADTTHGKITATLTDGSDIAANTSVQLVFSDGSAGQSNELKTTTLSLGSMAFADTADYDLSTDTLTSGNFEADIITGTTAGTGGIAVSDGNNKVLGSNSQDITLDLDISTLVTTASSEDLVNTDLVAVYDVSESQTKKATIGDVIATVSAGVTSLNAGRNLTEAEGDTEGQIDLDLDTSLVDVNSIKATEGDGANNSGNSFSLHGGAGTGTGDGGVINLKVAPAGASGSNLNAYSTAVRVNSDKTTDFNEKISITAASDGTAIDAGDFDIVNVNDLKIDRMLAHDAANLEIAFPAVSGGSVITIGDNLANALEIKQNAVSYLKFVSTNNFEEIVASQDFRIEGDLTVNGDTTTVSTSTLTVEDKRIVAATPDTNAATSAAQATNASGGGLALDTHLSAGTDDANYAAVTWSSTGDLTGWRFRDTAGATDYAASVMELNLSDDTAPTADSAGIGAFYFAAADGSTEGELYIRTL